MVNIFIARESVLFFLGKSKGAIPDDSVLAGNEMAEAIPGRRFRCW
jgi:hypothetical protein